MSMTIDMDAARKHAQALQKQMPELYDYLTQRDEATADMVEVIVRAIPNPDDLPEIKIPFIDFVIELAKPKRREECRFCDDTDGQLWFLSKQQHAALCHYCLNGIYIRGSGVRDLVNGSL